MKYAGEWIVDVLILSLVSSFAVTTPFYISRMWNLRKQFSIALRSPLLSCLCGTVLTMFSTIWAYVYVLEMYEQPEPGVGLDEQFFTEPWVQAFALLWASANPLSSCGLILWVLRLVVIYDPAKRKRWGRYVKEVLLLRGLLWTYAAAQVVGWAAVPFFGLQGVSFFSMAALDIAKHLCILGAIVLLGGPLRRMDDLCHLSKDGLHLGFVTLSSIVVHSVCWSVPVPRMAFKYGLTANAVLFCQFVVWKIDSRVACTAGRQKITSARAGLGSSSSCHLQGTPLFAIMEILPLQQAFGEFCRKSFCSESFQFLLEVSEFQSSFRHAQDSGGRSDDYGDFLRIVNEYIKVNSSSEVNIDSTTRSAILEFSERSEYESLDADCRESVFLPAQREISKMLMANLLVKFKATEEYKELADELVFEAN